MRPRRRLIILAIVIGAALGALPVLSRAARPASPAQRAAVVLAVQGSGYPVQCGVVSISTVNPTWASETFVGDAGQKVPSDCLPLAADGVAIVHIEHGQRQVVTEGSSFRCPIARGEVYSGQPNVPDAVADDLLGLACGATQCPRFIVGRANSSAYPHFRLPARGTALHASCATLKRIAVRLYQGTYRIPSGAIGVPPRIGSAFIIHDRGRPWRCTVQELGLSGPSYQFRCTDQEANLNWTTG